MKVVLARFGTTQQNYVIVKDTEEATIKIHAKRGTEKNSGNNDPEVATAVSLYMSYCSGVGYPYDGSNVAVQTTTQVVGSTNLVVTATRSSVVTATATSTTDQLSSAGMSTPFPPLMALFLALF